MGGKKFQSQKSLGNTRPSAANVRQGGRSVSAAERAKQVQSLASNANLDQLVTLSTGPSGGRDNVSQGIQEGIRRRAREQSQNAQILAAKRKVKENLERQKKERNPLRIPESQESVEDSDLVELNVLGIPNAPQQQQQVKKARQPDLSLVSPLLRTQKKTTAKSKAQVQGPPDTSGAGFFGIIPRADGSAFTVEGKFPEREPRPTFSDARLSIEKTLGIKSSPDFVKRTTRQIDESLQLSKPVRQRSQQNQFIAGVATPLSNFGKQAGDFAKALSEGPKSFTKLGTPTEGNPLGLPVPKKQTPLSETATSQFVAQLQDPSKKVKTKDPFIQGTAVGEVGLLAASLFGIRGGQKVGVKAKAAVDTQKNLIEVKKLAKTRKDEGIFGIEKVNQDIFVIDRGTELARGNTGGLLPTLAKNPLKNKIARKEVEIVKKQADLAAIRAEGNRRTPSNLKKSAKILADIDRAKNQLKTLKKKNKAQVSKQSGPSEVPLTVVKFGRESRFGKKEPSVTDITIANRGDALKPSFGLPRDIVIEGDIASITAKTLGLAKSKKITSGKLNPLERLALRESERVGELTTIGKGRTAPLSKVKSGDLSGFVGKNQIITQFAQTKNAGFKTPPRNEFGVSERAGSPKAPTLGSVGFERKLLDVGLSAARNRKGKNRITKRSSFDFKPTRQDSFKEFLEKTGLSTQQKKSTIKSTIKKQSASSKNTTKVSRQKNDFLGLPVVPSSITTETTITRIPGDAPKQDTSLLQDVLMGSTTRKTKSVFSLDISVTPKDKSNQRGIQSSDAIFTPLQRVPQLQKPSSRGKQGPGIITNQISGTVTRTGTGLTPILGNPTTYPPITTTKLIPGLVTPPTTFPPEDPLIPPRLAFGKFPFLLRGNRRGSQRGDKTKFGKKFLVSNLDPLSAGVIARAGVPDLLTGKTSAVFARGDKALSTARNRKSKGSGRRRSVLKDPLHVNIQF